MTTSPRLTLLGVAAALGTSSLSLSHAQPVQYCGVELIDPAERRLQSDSFIRVENGLISALGQGCPSASGVEIVEMPGAYAMPGLIDTHAHLTLGAVGVDFSGDTPVPQVIYDDAITRHNARMLLAHGVTSIRNPGGSAAVNTDYARQERDGSLIGPYSQNAGDILDSTHFPGLTEQVLSFEEIDRAIARQAALGVDYIKLYTGLSLEQLEYAIGQAHQYDLRTVAHLEDVSWTDASAAGLDAIVHAMPVSPDLLDEAGRAHFADQGSERAQHFYTWYEVADLEGPQVTEMIETMVENNVTFDATIVVFERAYMGNLETEADWDSDIVHPAQLANWQAGVRFDALWTVDDYARAQAVYPQMLELVRLMHEAGVHMTIGTDQGNPFVAPGASVSEEMQIHLDAGIPAWDVLKMATINGAVSLGLGDQTGRLAEGFEADILLLNSDPLADFANLRDIALVIEDGVAFDPVELRAPEAAPSR
jgi:imidazolonepropionase-like amidohydrolase